MDAESDDDSTYNENVDSGNVSSDGDDFAMEIESNIAKERQSEPEDFPFEVLTTDQIVQHMVDSIREVTLVVEVRFYAEGRKKLFSFCYQKKSIFFCHCFGSRSSLFSFCFTYKIWLFFFLCAILNGLPLSVAKEWEIQNFYFRFDLYKDDDLQENLFWDPF